MHKNSLLECFAICQNYHPLFTMRMLAMKAHNYQVVIWGISHPLIIHPMYYGYFIDDTPMAQAKVMY
jgi:hypothetical protein